MVPSKTGKNLIRNSNKVKSMSNLKMLFSMLITAIITLSGCIPAKSNLTETDSTEILAVEQQRIDYLASGSYDELADMLSPTLSYTHSNAILDDKDAFMEELTSGRVVYRNMNHQDLQVRFLNPTTAIINGISDVSVTVQGEDLEVPLRVTIVYVKIDGKWLFEAWHSVRRP
jgi:uncharacterized protein (TIGR02246 family)